MRKSKASQARLLGIELAHGKLTAPFFMPDATRAAVKGISAAELARTGLSAMVVNTYHLYLQPGSALARKAGGVNRFMGYAGPLFSDSGGYQVFSLVHRAQSLGRISDEGVVFKSPVDGSRHELTPERSIQLQFDLGTDAMVCLDDCPPNDFSRAKLAESVARTVEWAKRSKAEYGKQLKKRKLAVGRRPLLFAVVQGGAEADLREQCARELVKLDFDGYGFGARPVDASGRFLGEVLGLTASLIPADKLRFALGIGKPEDIVRSVRLGWDIFDCVIPTREGRHGRLFGFAADAGFEYRAINITNAAYKADFRPIAVDARTPALRVHTRAYLHHLFRIGDPLGQRLAALNNLEFYAGLMARIRQEIRGNGL